MHTSGSEWSSDSTSHRERDATELKDEVDLALSKCLEDQSALKKLKIEKVEKGLYRLESKQFRF